MKDRTATDNLKQQIKALASQGKDLHTQIIKLRSEPDTGPERSQLWMYKRSVGRDARCALLAYAYLRGVPYKAVEPKAVVGNIPWIGAIAPYVDPDFDKLPRNGPEREKIRVGVKDWLDSKPAEQPVVAAEAAVSNTEAA